MTRVSLDWPLQDVGVDLPELLVAPVVPSHRPHRGTPARLRLHPPRSLARWPLSASEHIYAVYWHPCAPVSRCLVDAPLFHTHSRLLLLPPLALVWPARPWFLVCPHHTSLRRSAPAFAVLGIAAPPCPAPHPIPLPAHSPLTPAWLPHWPTIHAPAHNCRPRHNPLRTPCARPSYLQLHTAPPRIILPPRAPPALLVRFCTMSLPACSPPSVRAASLRLYSAPRTYSLAATAQRVALLCPAPTTHSGKESYGHHGLIP
ncbi:hypothetical protein DFH08DRAFT_954166 [Mycena albidolilacea]|uniref:Uncharacterized protein n=1 Tax=Mycena albidolilacea TaxID=1033008 RepID=A0AAD7AET4_9AGAR|nr:hypothetical protein DFH08DRAFT_954166 [Mycena albidolilacea]